MSLLSMGANDSKSNSTSRASTSGTRLRKWSKFNGFKAPVSGSSTDPMVPPV